MPSGLSLPPHSLLSSFFRSSSLLPPWGDLGPQSQTQEATQTVKGPGSIAHHPTCPAVLLLSAVPTLSVCWQQTEAGPPCPPPITSFRYLRSRGSRKDKFNLPPHLISSGSCVLSLAGVERAEMMMRMGVNNNSAGFLFCFFSFGRAVCGMDS